MFIHYSFIQNLLFHISKISILEKGMLKFRDLSHNYFIEYKIQLRLKTINIMDSIYILDLF